MDYEYDADDYGGRVLWGRVAFYVATLLLMLLLGRACSGGGESADLVTTLQRQVAALTSENDSLKAQLALIQQQPGTSATSPLTTPTGSSTETIGSVNPSGDATSGATDGATTGTGQPSTYTVEANDTLRSIAEDVYGDAEKWRLIAEANDLDGSSQLQIGQELVIPPNE